MSYGGCPTCVSDEWGRVQIGWCGPDCERRKRRLAAIVADREAMATFQRARERNRKAFESSPQWRLRNEAS